MPIIIQITSNCYKSIWDSLSNDCYYVRDVYNAKKKCYIHIDTDDNHDRFLSYNHYNEDNILLFENYDESFELLTKMSDDVLGIYYDYNGVSYGSEGVPEYKIITDKVLCKFKNISYIYANNIDIISVLNNKLIFFADVDWRYQKYNPDLYSEACKTSMKLEFEKINFDSIECATIVIVADAKYSSNDNSLKGIIKDNYYHSLRWISKMSNLKKLNLFLEVDQQIKNIEEFINDINITILLKKLTIKSPRKINLSMLKIPFGTIVTQSLTQSLI